MRSRSICCCVYSFPSLFPALCKVHCPADTCTYTHTHRDRHTVTHTLAMIAHCAFFLNDLLRLLLFLLPFAFYIHCFPMNETAAPKGRKKEGVVSEGAWHGQCQVLLLPDNGVKINTRKCVYNCIIV